MSKITKQQIETMRRLREQLGKCRAWITGFEAGSGKRVLEADSLRQVQLLFDEIMRADQP